ncbi:MAG: chemotaxis response regulator protein-glutamate methylesterase [Candidatus Auribacterota bacterium]|jgi:two-component system chemotaxis response regulator CheB|nr:chemotaxis response regulator protein-glutamate methylesterase [Candidatus Auribacterota bacterium]
MIKVLVVDDSSFMRQELTRLISDDPDIEVIGTAFDGAHALKKIPILKPDVVTLDIEMPQMDGLTALKHIMISHPLPVVIISSLTQKGAEITFEAIQLGAVEVIPKPSGTISLNIKQQKQEIIEKIKAAHKVDCKKIRRIAPPAPVVKKYPPMSTECSHIVAIGVSTGGPQTLMKIIPQLPGDLPAAIMVVQHMPPVFTKSFATRLNSVSNLTVKEAENNDIILEGHVYIAPGGYHMTAGKNGKHIEISEEPSGTLHRPSVDVMFDSLVKGQTKQLTGVILTGMGKDGAAGLKKIHDKGFSTIGESESSSVVYGMPREAANMGAVDFVLDKGDIASKIIELVSRGSKV